MTLLGVSPAEVPKAFKEVLASLYALNVLKYRLSRGLHPFHGMMAVGCLGLVEARASGVIYTLDPSQPQRDVLVVTAVWGLRGRPWWRGPPGRTDSKSRARRFTGYGAVNRH